MNLDENQKKIVTGWIADGSKLSDIQKRLETEFGLRPTYLDVRLLVDDLKLVPKDQEIAKTAVIGKATAAAAAKPVPGTPSPPATATLPGATAPGDVSLTVDAVTRPGAVVSGRVTFSDDQKAEWYLDQMGRLGMVPEQQGYRPAAGDLQIFQAELQNELQRLGF